MFVTERSRTPSCQNPSDGKNGEHLTTPNNKNTSMQSKCLMTRPSQVEPGTYRYDDFVYTHTKEGTSSHYAAAFLAWHRYFKRVFNPKWKCLHVIGPYLASLMYRWSLCPFFVIVSSSSFITIICSGLSYCKYGYYPDVVSLYLLLNCCKISSKDAIKIIWTNALNTDVSVLSLDAFI